MKPVIKKKIDKVKRGEVPEGYRKTKTGIIPKEWDIKRLNEIGGKRREKNRDGSIVNVFSNSAINGIVMQLDFFDKSIANKNNITSYFKVRKDDFVYNPRISSTAPCGPINRNKTGYDGVVSPLYTVFYINNGDYNIDYIENYYKSSHWHSYMYGVANYGARSDRMNIRDADFFNMPIIIPPKLEQQKIVEILYTWDRFIELKERLIEQKKKQKKGLMQWLLTGKKRLSGFKGEWREVRLGEICDITTGKLDANAMKEDGQYAFFTCGREVYRIDKYAFDTEALLISGNGANVGYIHYYKGKFNAYQRTYVLNYFSENIFFIKYMLEQYLSKRIDREKNAGNTPYIVMDTLTKMKLKVPSLKEQIIISDILSIINKEIELLEQELEALKIQKKGLMQLLLTGIVRVIRSD